MRSQRFRIIVCTAIVALLLIGCASVAFAAPKVNWYTAGVYYNGDGKLVIHGYFKNEGTVAVDRINWITAVVRFQGHDGSWWVGFSGTWSNFDIYLAPGETKRYTLISTDTVKQYRFSNFNVSGTINYHIAPEIPDA